MMRLVRAYALPPERISALASRCSNRSSIQLQRILRKQAQRDTGEPRTGEDEGPVYVPGEDAHNTFQLRRAEAFGLNCTVPEVISGTMKRALPPANKSAPPVERLYRNPRMREHVTTYLAARCEERIVPCIEAYEETDKSLCTLLEYMYSTGWLAELAVWHEVRPLPCATYPHVHAWISVEAAKYGACVANSMWFASCARLQMHPRELEDGKYKWMRHNYLDTNVGVCHVGSRFSRDCNIH